MDFQDQRIVGISLAFAPFVALLLFQGGTQINVPLTVAGIASFFVGAYFLLSLKNETEQTTLPTETA